MDEQTENVWRIRRLHHSRRSLVKLGVLGVGLLLGHAATAQPDESRGTVGQGIQLAAPDRSEARKKVAAEARAARVTLEGTMSLADALRQLRSQSRNDVRDLRELQEQPIPDGSLHVALRDVPFWKAVATVEEQAGVEVTSFAGEPDMLVLGPRPVASASPRGNRPLVRYDGPFRIEIARIASVWDRRDPEGSGLRLVLELIWEPRLVPVRILQPLDNLRVLDDRGNRMAFRLDDKYLDIAFQVHIPTAEFTIPLPLPPRKANRLTSVRGKFVVLFPNEPVDFVFDDLIQQDVRQEQSGVAVTMQRVFRNADVLDVRLRIDLPPADSDVPDQRAWVYLNPVMLRGADQESHDYVGLEALQHQGDSILVSYKFDVTEAKGWTLVYRTPTLIVPVTFDYEFKDVLLP